jgi:hypothetical protein
MRLLFLSIPVAGAPREMAGDGRASAGAGGFPLSGWSQSGREEEKEEEGEGRERKRWGLPVSL